MFFRNKNMFKVELILRRIFLVFYLCFANRNNKYAY